MICGVSDGVVGGVRVVGCYIVIDGVMYGAIVMHAVIVIACVFVVAGVIDAMIVTPGVIVILLCGYYLCC